MLNPTCCKLSPVTELQLKHKLQFNTTPRNCISILLAAAKNFTHSGFPFRVGLVNHVFTLFMKSQMSPLAGFT
jgi:hypothetical protein